MSEANRVSLKTIPEVTYGTTPSNGTWQALPFTSTSLAAAPQSVVSNNIRADRQVQDLIKVGEAVSGEMGIEYCMGTFDELLEAALCGEWTADVLEIGTEQPSFSIEAGYEDWSPTQYIQFKGMRVGAMNLTFPYGAIVTGGFSFVGKSATSSTTSLVGTGTTTADPANTVVQGSTNVSSILLDGGAPGSVIKSISLNLDNSMRPIEGIGNAGPSDQAYGRAMVTGSVEMYFDDIAMYDKLIANTAASLQWTVGDGVNSHTFLMDNIKFNDGQPDVSGVDTDVMLTMNFTSLFDPTHSALKITRA